MNTGVSTIACGNCIVEVRALVVEHSASTVNLRAEVAALAAEEAAAADDIAGVYSGDKRQNIVDSKALPRIMQLMWGYIFSVFHHSGK